MHWCLELFHRKSDLNRKAWCNLCGESWRTVAQTKSELHIKNDLQDVRVVQVQDLRKRRVSGMDGTHFSNCCDLSANISR